jgi:hypothetical protein
MIRPWPWRDSPLQRRERVAQTYRAALERVAPDVCAELDAQMLTYGQRWLIPTVLAYGPDDLLTAILTADYAGVSLKTVYVWRERGLPSIITPDGIRFRFQDVQAWMGGARDRVRFRGPSDG